MAKTPLFRRLQRLENPSRRHFLKVAAAAGSALLLAKHEQFLPLAKAKEPVVILGAGAAGLAAAYELKSLNIPFVIYEAAQRSGGRVLTRENFNNEGMFCELGAELIDSHHEYLFDLAKNLNVELEKLNQQDAINQAFYFKNQFLIEKDVLPEFKKLTECVRKDMEKIFAGQTEKFVDYQNHSAAARHFDHMTLEAYLNNLKKVDPYVRDLVRVAYVCEFGLEADQQSALNILLLMNPEQNQQVEFYGSSDEAWRVKGGNSKLVKALTDKVAPSGEIQYGHRLVGMSEKNSKMVLNFQHNGISKEVYAEKVICTIPFPVLRSIDGIEKLALSERKHYAIKHFQMGVNTKLITGFSERFWTDHFQGQLYTQLDSQVFWDTSRHQPGRSGILTNYTGGDRARHVNDQHFDLALQDFSSIFPRAPRYANDGQKAVANWSKNNLAYGSYACPTPGSYTDYIGSLSTPELNHKLYFAGEHTSEFFLGYINGALESGRNAALEIALALKSS